MKNIFIINGSKVFGGSEGKLNDHLTMTAREHLISKGMNVRVTRIDDGYDNEQEVLNYLWADLIIYQMPAWWMEGPWIVKKYIDDVFTQSDDRFHINDGRTRHDISKKYGSGGVLTDKKYMLSVTWNAPQEAFEDDAQFFEGRGVDSVYFPFHKANQFTGMSPLPTFACFDVVKNPQIETDISRYLAHLDTAVSG
ncbi:NAD(P)H-dependent oxidoreductase [Morganella psychrotolerans]|uniref:NAD(P)H-dependent oxidoreductase n=1 Tax=Morganella psychrotolerans TaxID=368603 RepID=A0A5M9RA08_9GAMM|nr:NAD(P)H-dependent oxidoreductase [Morganella psychrotolerans]KAA8717570.1 NAD(P)H-dependent oxidoreductase [Morganella psychrotolerans]OBU08172.1 NADPH quinone reductase [Morganella psychrotolerans]